MATLIRNGRIVTAVDDYVADNVPVDAGRVFSIELKLEVGGGPASACPHRDTIRSSVRLDRHLHYALRPKAAQSRCSISEILNDAFRQALRDGQDDLVALRSRTRENASEQEAFLAKLEADDTL